MTKSTGDKKGSFWRNFDVLFGQQAAFYISGKERRTSVSAGVLTFILFAILLATVIYYVIYLFNKINPTIQINMSEDLHASLNLSSSNFMFGLGFKDLPDEDLETYFNFTMQVNTVLREANGTRTLDNSSYSFTKCNKSQFNFPHIDFSEKFERYELSNFYCPDISNNTEISIEGTYLSDLYKYVMIKVLPCDNKESSKCKDPNEIRSFLDEQEENLKLSFVFTNMLMKLQNYTNPQDIYLESYSWVLSPLTKTKASEIFMSPYQISTFAHPFTSGKTSSAQGYRVERANFKDFEQGYVRKGDLYAKSFMNIVFRVDSIQTVYQRNYMKALEVPGKLGGLYAFLVATIGFLAIHFNKRVLKVDIANQIYGTEEEKPQQRKDGVSLSLQEMDSSGAGGQGGGLDPDKKLEKINNQFVRLIQGEKVKDSFFEFVVNKFCWCFKWRCRRRRVNVINHIEKKLSTDLDVIQILKRLQELEKLKDILLTPQQKLILEYTPKPKLNPWISKGDPDYESMLSRSLATALPVKSQFLTKNEFLELYRAYLHITKDKDPMYGTHERALDQPLIMKKDEYSSNNRGRYFPNHGTSINYFPNLPQSHSVITTFSGQTMPHNQHHINWQPTRYDRKGS